jgi:CheY-like chemotaxis protein
MSAPTLMLSQTSRAIGFVKKKRVLLVDSSRTKRDLRSETMRRLGAEVDCAADVSEARCWWRPNLYDLVLIHMDDAAKSRDKLCEHIRNFMPTQPIMFLVGGPEYLASSPNADQGISAQEKEVGSALFDQMKPPSSKNGTHQRGGILEACRRISEVRSALDARTKPIRDRPLPTRDSESRRRKGADGPGTLAKLSERSITETKETQ